MDEVKLAIHQDDKESLIEALQSCPHVPDIAKQLADEGLFLVIEMCKRGYSCVLQILVELGVSLTDPQYPETAIQTACRYNRPNVLLYLLGRVDQILPEGVQIWHAASPFYIASKCGHSEIVDLLLDHSPSLVKGEGVRSCLMYAACLGGNVNIVKRWMVPSMDINHPLPVLETFNDCWSKTPLFAACSGGHRDIVQFLLDNYEDLQLTADVCNRFPDIIYDVIRRYFKPQEGSDDELFQLYSCHLRRRNLYCLHSSWLLPYAVTLVEINVSGNFLEELPSCLPWSFHNLRLLRAEDNSIKALASPKMPSGVEVFCPSLEEVYLTRNQLTYVCPELFQLPSLKTLYLAHNKLNYLIRSYHQYADEQMDSASTLQRQSVIGPQWCCPSLTKLDISHNSLQMLPPEMNACTGLVSLVASDNKLSTFPQPWECPLSALNLSWNQLERFPVNVEEYWCDSLIYLNISHNQLDEINEGIFKLSVLIDLDASHNKIERLPRPELWECGHLHNLNLKHNRLGRTCGITSPKGIDTIFPLKIGKSNKRLSLMEDSRQLTFPPLFSTCLHELRLSHNDLPSVPPSICDLKMLEILDLSHNPIKSLPIKLGKLSNCANINLKGMTLSNVPADYCTGKVNRTKQLLSGFLDTLRECQEYHKLKVVVLGKKDKGKTTLVNLLAGTKEPVVSTRSVIIHPHIKLHARKGSFSLLPEKQSLQLTVWDMAGDEDHLLAYNSVFTPFSLYLLVWDFWRIAAETDQIAQWVYNIQATTPRCKVILVGTFLDKLPLKADEKKAALEVVQEKVNKKLRQGETLIVCAVSCMNNEGIEQLKTTIFETAMGMTIPGRKPQRLIGRKVPKSYLLMESLVADELKKRNKCNKPPFITKAEFSEIIEKLDAKNNDITSSGEFHLVTKFLVETGSLLHYTEQLGSLNTLFFLDPAWLVDVLVAVFKSPEVKQKLKNGKGKISLDEVERLYMNDPRFPPEYVDQYVLLLGRFHIAIAMNNSQNLLFPSMLPDKQPMSEVTSQDGQCQVVRRLYRMAELPQGFWTHLMSHVLARVEQFSTVDWTHRPKQAQSFRNISVKPSMRIGQYNIARNGSLYGLQIKDPQKIFCQEWMMIQHNDGYICIEPVSYDPQDGKENLPKGLLITEKTKDGDFSSMGIIIDEIEDILHDFYPGLIEPDEYTMQTRLMRYALCPSCYHGNPPTATLNHFTMEHCARMMMCGDTITCIDKGIKHHLQDLVPDMLLGELPEKFFLDVSKLQYDETEDNLLGRGVTGSVFRGTYGSVDVAVKLYRSDIRGSARDRVTDNSMTSTSSDSGTATVSSKGSTSNDVFIDDDGPTVYINYEHSTQTLDLDEEESMKSFNALREMRQEVALTSRLQHPCIVGLLGLAFSPRLLMVMELAPLGSLRAILDQKMSLRPVFNKYRDREKVFPALLDKWLTFKIIYQIGKGLDYLHSSGIIYKDLKSDNILAISTSVTDIVNVKLSDYGISKYCLTGATVGLVGTPGYQAPEILDGLAYDEKVDMFSFAMVIYEVLTGRRPYEEYENMAQISKALKNDDVRPNIQAYNVHSRFPYLEHVMQECWQKDATKRLAAATVVSKRCMQNTEFVCQAAVFKTPDKQTFAMDSILTASSHEKGQMLLWLWEGTDSARRVSILDMETAGFRYYKHKAKGPQVTCMSRVGKYVWVGTQANEVEVFGFEHSDLVTMRTIQLNAVPVQIETYFEQPSSHVPSVLVALENCQINLYQPLQVKGPPIRRQTLKTTQGFREPTTITLRSEELFCMQLTSQTREIWVSVDGYIDTVDRGNFKVTTENRINLEILNKMCNIPGNRNVSQMCCFTNEVYCLMCNSPFVLGFCETTYNCMSVLNCGEPNIYRTIAGRFPSLSDDDHKAYHGQIRTGLHTRSKSESDLLNDHESENTSRGRVNNSNTGNSVKALRNIFEEGSTSNASSTEGIRELPSNSQTSQITVDIDGNPSDKTPTGGSDPIEESVPVRTGSRRKDMISKCLPTVDSVPDLPPRPVWLDSSDSSTTVPPLPRRVSMSNSDVPRIPPRRPTVTDDNGALRDIPQVPPRLSRCLLRPVTHVFEGNMSNRRMLGPQSSRSLPTSYRRNISNDFGIVLTSMVAIGDSLWIGRSHGDICVVNIDWSQDCRVQFGKVNAVMYDLARKARGHQMEEGVKLLKVGDYIASAILLENENEAYCELASWESYDITDIQRIDRFWSDILYIESKLVEQRPTIEAQDPALLQVGQF